MRTSVWLPGQVRHGTHAATEAGMMFSSPMNLRLPRPDQALPGRQTPMPVPEHHAVNGARITPPFPAGLEQVVFGMGCFWGAERKFWQAPGVYSTAVGYAGGYTPNPTYKEVCSGMTGHTEVVLVVFDPKVTSYDAMLTAVLGEPRSDAGHASGQRCRHAVSFRDLHLDARAEEDRRSVARVRIRIG